LHKILIGLQNKPSFRILRDEGFLNVEARMFSILVLAMV